MCIVVEMPYRKITKQISINKSKIKAMKTLASKTNRQSVMKSYSFLNNGWLKPRSIVWKHLCAALQKYSIKDLQEEISLSQIQNPNKANR